MLQFKPQIDRVFRDFCRDSATIFFHFLAAKDLEPYIVS